MRKAILRGIIPLLLFVITGGAGSARGHAVVIGSRPENGAVLAHAPDQVTLRFNAMIEPSLTRMNLR